MDARARVTLSCQQGSVEFARHVCLRAVGVSVFDACRTSARLAQYSLLRLSTFGRIRGSGFALLATFDHPHFTLVMPDLAELTLMRLDRCFDDPIPNPGRPPRL